MASRGRSSHLPKMSKEERARRELKRLQKGRDRMAARERNELRLREQRELAKGVRTLNKMMHQGGMSKIVANEKRIVGFDHG